MVQAFFTKLTLDSKLSQVLPGQLVDPYPPKFQFSENFKVTRHFVTIARLHFQWLKFDIKIQGMAGNKMFFLPKRLRKITFSEALARISALTQWTP